MTDSIHDKIRKLLALSEGNTNDSEADQAFQMASKLMMKHGIEADQLRSPTDHAPTVGAGKQRWAVDYVWYRSCASAAGMMYMTKSVYYSRTNDFVFVGRQDNIAATEATYVFIILQIEQLYKAALPKGLTKGDRAAFRKDFKMACANRVSQRIYDLMAEMDKPTNTDGALVIYKHREILAAEVTDYLSSIGCRTTKAKSLTIKSASAYAAGQMAGNQVDIHRKVK